VIVHETTLDVRASAFADGIDDPPVNDVDLKYYPVGGQLPILSGISLHALASAQSGAMLASGQAIGVVFDINADQDELFIAVSGFGTAFGLGQTILGYSSGGGFAEVGVRFSVDKPYHYLFSRSWHNAPDIGFFGQPIPCLGCPSLPPFPQPSSGVLVPGVWYRLGGIAQNHYDGVHANSRFDVWLSMSANGPIGTSQQAPIPPSSTPSSDESAFIFEDATSGLWFDPPITDEYTYTMSSPGSLFTAILDFPTGFADPFEVVVGGNSLGYFLSGQMADFSAFPGGGVSEFVVRGINPGVDVEDAAGFPLRIAFNTPTANFVMTPTGIVPEPGAMLLVTLGIIQLLSARIRRM